MQLESLSADILLHIAGYLSYTNLNSLLQTNKFFVQLLTPRFHELALESKDYGTPALYWAAGRGFEPLVRLLLERVTYDEMSMEIALKLAARYGHTGTAGLLLDRGANIEARDMNGEKRTALLEAAVYGQEEMIRFLLKRGANIGAVDDEGMGALHWAVTSGHAVVDLTLRELGVEHIWKLDEWLRKDVWQLADDRARRTVMALLENGANADAREETGDTPLHVAVNSATEEDKDVVFTTFKLVCGTNINATNNEGETALHVAAVLGVKAAVKFLLTKDIDIEARNSQSQTALHNAVLAECSSYETVKLLLENGADTGARDIGGETAIHYALRANDELTNEPNPELVSLLLEWGADADSICDGGLTPLHKAVISRSQENVKLLLENNAYIYARNGDGNTPLEEACLLNLDQGIIRLLSDADADMRAGAEMVDDSHTT